MVLADVDTQQNSVNHLLQRILVRIQGIFRCSKKRVETEKILGLLLLIDIDI